jgi:hypothetical protein
MNSKVPAFVQGFLTGTFYGSIAAVPALAWVLAKVLFHHGH